MVSSCFDLSFLNDLLTVPRKDPACPDPDCVRLEVLPPHVPDGLSGKPGPADFLTFKDRDGDLPRWGRCWPRTAAALQMVGRCLMEPLPGFVPLQRVVVLPDRLLLLFEVGPHFQVLDGSLFKAQPAARQVLLLGMLYDLLLRCQHLGLHLWSTQMVLGLEIDQLRVLGLDQVWSQRFGAPSDGFAGRRPLDAHRKEPVLSEPYRRLWAGWLQILVPPSSGEGRGPVLVRERQALLWRTCTGSTVSNQLWLELADWIVPHLPVLPGLAPASADAWVPGALPRQVSELRRRAGEQTVVWRAPPVTHGLLSGAFIYSCADAWHSEQRWSSCVVSLSGERSSPARRRLRRLLNRLIGTSDEWVSLKKGFQLLGAYLAEEATVLTLYFAEVPDGLAGFVARLVQLLKQVLPRRLFILIQSTGNSRDLSRGMSEPEWDDLSPMQQRFIALMVLCPSGVPNALAATLVTPSPDEGRPCSSTWLSKNAEFLGIEQVPFGWNEMPLFRADPHFVQRRQGVATPLIALMKRRLSRLSPADLPALSLLAAALRPPVSRAARRLFLEAVSRFTAEWDFVGLSAFLPHLEGLSDQRAEKAQRLYRTMQGLPPLIPAGRLEGALPKALRKIYQLARVEARALLNRVVGAKKTPPMMRCYALVLIAEQAALHGKLAVSLAARDQCYRVAEGLSRSERLSFWLSRVQAACLEAEYRCDGRVSVTQALVFKSDKTMTYDPEQRWLAAVSAACLGDPLTALDHLLWLDRHPEYLVDRSLRLGVGVKIATLFQALGDGCQARGQLVRTRCWALSEGATMPARRLAWHLAESLAEDGRWAEAFAVFQATMSASEPLPRRWLPAFTLAQHLLFDAPCDDVPEAAWAQPLSVWDEWACLFSELSHVSRLGRKGVQAAWSRAWGLVKHPALSLTEKALLASRLEFFKEWLARVHPELSLPDVLLPDLGSYREQFASPPVAVWRQAASWLREKCSEQGKSDRVGLLDLEHTGLTDGERPLGLPDPDAATPWDLGVLHRFLRSMEKGGVTLSAARLEEVTRWQQSFYIDGLPRFETPALFAAGTTCEGLPEALWRPMNLWRERYLDGGSVLPVGTHERRVARSRLKQALNLCLRRWLQHLDGLEYGAFDVPDWRTAKAWRPNPFFEENSGSLSWRETVRDWVGLGATSCEVQAPEMQHRKIARFHATTSCLETASLACLRVKGEGAAALLVWWIVPETEKTTTGVFQENLRVLFSLCREWLSWSIHVAEPVAPAVVEPFGMVGESAALQHVIAEIHQYAPSELPIFIGGETGTGKELAARAVHRASDRCRQTFHALNCAQYPENLIESHLFGYRQGSFTDAREDRPGLLECSDGGTLFLDEIGDITPKVQALLLRVLQEGEFTRVGDYQVRRVDVRFVTATHADLVALVAEGRFRADLYYRLMGVGLTLPPLRRRKEDIPLLLAHFGEKHAPERRLSFSTSMVEALQEHPWPGNIRELEMYVRRLLAAHAEVNTFWPAHLPPFQRVTNREITDKANLPTLKVLERRRRMDLLADRLAMFAGNRSAAAKSLGISRQYLSQLLNQGGGGGD